MNPLDLPATPGITDPTGGDVIGQALMMGRELVALFGTILAVGVFIALMIAAWLAGKGRRRGHGWGWMFSLALLSGGVAPFFVLAAFPAHFNFAEQVECPTCMTKIRFNSKKCGSCHQTLNPNLQVGRDVVNQFAQWGRLLRWTPHIFTGLAVVGGSIAFLLNDEDFYKTGWQWAMVFFLIAGVAGALWWILPMRRQLADELYFELVGNEND